jgi:hypothetical protein
MANNNLTIHTNQIFALVLKSPIQTGWLSNINSVTNISRLGTFKGIALPQSQFPHPCVCERFIYSQDCMVNIFPAAE